MAEPAPHTRRQVLRGLAGVGIGGLGGLGLGLALGGTDVPAEGAGDRTEGLTGPPTPIAAHGTTQAGIERPETPQRHGAIAVLDLAEAVTAAQVLTICAAVGELISTLTTATTPPRPELPDGPGDLTVHLGLGPRLVQLLGPDLPGAEDLPPFAGDTTLEGGHTGGDLLLAAYSWSPNDADAALTQVISAVGPAEQRWAQRGFRAPGTGTVTRNPLGFHDGVIVPRGEEELTEHVWLPDGPAAGGTIAVIRRLRLDTAAFRVNSVPEREQIIGREHATGAPLSGGGPMDEVDLRAKTPAGEFLTPARSHARAAHPSFTDSQLMLRRGYAFDNGSTAEGKLDSGLLFICFQRDLNTFIATQHRLDEVDNLMDYVTTTASATFLILPGFDPEHPLGATLA